MWVNFALVIERRKGGQTRVRNEVIRHATRTPFFSLGGNLLSAYGVVLSVCWSSAGVPLNGQSCISCSGTLKDGIAARLPASGL